MVGGNAGVWVNEGIGDDVGVWVDKLAVAGRVEVGDSLHKRAATGRLTAPLGHLSCLAVRGCIGNGGV